ncbi:hypothetical protein FHR72_003547 [Mycolicibacterium iranicum]|uniref:Uncharacterized protein n=1 Tax=Mycolicibacterium iranicum TaxID=912594 RepID=A0A839QIB6_MYCIR|nr:hypothetical protein [Mycolicibacterium iranicum]MBB2992051.1 hypothetical protein [Mycolicibacterium iranicum]
MSRRVRTICVALWCALPATARSPFSGSGEDPLEAELATVRDGGRAVPLHDLTDFAWDEVHLFNEYTRADVLAVPMGGNGLRLQNPA